MIEPDMERAVAEAERLVRESTQVVFPDANSVNLARAFLALRERDKRLVEKWRAEADNCDGEIMSDDYYLGLRNGRRICADELEGKP